MEHGARWNWDGAMCRTFDAEVIGESEARARQLRQLGYFAAARELESLAVAMREQHHHECLCGFQLEAKKFGFPPAAIGEAATLYLAGWSLIRLAEKFGCMQLAAITLLLGIAVLIRSKRIAASMNRRLV